MSTGFDAGVEKKKPEEATMEVANGEAERVAKRQASAEANSVKRRKEASRQRCHTLLPRSPLGAASPPRRCRLRARLRPTGGFEVLIGMPPARPLAPDGRHAQRMSARRLARYM